MHAALRPYVTAGVALVGSSVIAVTPITPPQPETRSVNWDVSLAAAATDLCTAGDTSAACNAATERAEFAETLEGLGLTTAADTPNLFNIAANLFIATANVPYNFLNALGAGDVELGEFSFQPSYDEVSLQQDEVVGLAEHYDYAGSWWVYSPTNVLGTDAGDIVRYQALTNVGIPFPALSVPLGNMLAAIVASQLPMNVGCTGTGAGACPNLEAILSKMFDLRHIADMLLPGGYDFPEVKNPITCDADGQCDILDPDGETMPWSEQNAQLDLSAPFTNFYNSLNATPDFSQIRIPSLEMIADTFVKLLAGLNTAYNPFVLGTQCGLCAPLVPNPGGDPVPGPINPGTTPLDVTNLNVSTLAAPGGDVAPGEELGGEENSTVSDEHDNSLQRTLNTSLQETTPVAEPEQGLVNTEVDPTTPVDDTDVTLITPTDLTKVDNNAGINVDPVPAGPRHRKPGGPLSDLKKSVQETISKLTGGAKDNNTNQGANTNEGASTNQGDANTDGEANKGGEAGSGNATQ